MATLRDIKNRITSVKSTQQITKAMKMVAAAKLRKAQEAITNARPYPRRIATLLSNLSTPEDIANNELLNEREVKNVAIVSVTSDRGLCGAFNINIIKEVQRFIQSDLPDKNIQMFCVGRKGFEFFSKNSYDVKKNMSLIFSHLQNSYAVELTNDLVQLYLSGQVDKVYIVYNEFKSIINQRIVVEQFLPVPIESFKEEKKETQPLYIYEPDRPSIFNYLLPKYLKSQMWRILLESNASELGAKMTAMDNATSNANELIRTLKLTYNKERQAAITKEILEIVSGANALKSS